MEDERQESEKCDVEVDRTVDREDGHIEENTDLEAYFDEPIADEVWLEDYHRRREENNKRMAVRASLEWNQAYNIVVIFRIHLL